MGKLQILVTSMFQTDLSKVKEMNIQSDVLIANQSDGYEYVEDDSYGFKVQMITTNTRGTSKNRNIAISCSNPEAEYIMFSDDDLIFVDGYEELVCKEFEKHPEADAFKFNLEAISERTLGMKYITEYKRAGIRDITASGVWGLAIRRECLIKNNLHFNENFGPGTENYCGEDTIFLLDIIKSKVKLYMHPLKVADITQTNSTWYEGRTERYFRTTGAVLSQIYPKLSPLLALRSAYRFSKREGTNMSFSKIYKLYLEGIKKNLKG